MTKSEALAMAEYAFSQEINVSTHAHVDIANDLIAGFLLSQIMYWFTPDKNGNSKIKVRKKDGYWLAKSRQDWYDEIRISPKQYDRAVKILKEKDLVETKLYRFDGSPMIHIRPKWDSYKKQLEAWKEHKAEEFMAADMDDEDTADFPILPKGKNRISPKVKIQFDERVKTLTENTTKNTSETTNIDNIECIPTECPIGHDANAWHWQDDDTYYNYINSVLPRYINNILPTSPDDNSSYNIYYTVIAGFYESYHENVGEYHPWYKEEALRRVIESLNDFFEIIDCDTIFECMRLFFSKGNIRSKHLMVFCQYDMLRFLTAEIECDYKGILLDAK